MKQRNFVAVHDFNRGGAHKSPRDYTRASKQSLLDEAYEYEYQQYAYIDHSMEEGWGVHWEDEEDLPLKDPKQWESIKETAL